MLGTKRRKLLASMIVLTMVLAQLPFPSYVKAAGSPTLGTTVTVTGVPEGGTIDGEQVVELAVTIKVPVIGDGTGDYFEWGEEVEDGWRRTTGFRCRDERVI